MHPDIPGPSPVQFVPLRYAPGGAVRRKEMCAISAYAGTLSRFPFLTLFRGLLPIKLQRFESVHCGKPSCMLGLSKPKSTPFEYKSHTAGGPVKATACCVHFNARFTRYTRNNKNLKRGFSQAGGHNPASEESARGANRTGGRGRSVSSVAAVTAAVLFLRRAAAGGAGTAAAAAGTGGASAALGLSVYVADNEGHHCDKQNTDDDGRGTGHWDSPFSWRAFRPFLPVRLSRRPRRAGAGPRPGIPCGRASRP